MNAQGQPERVQHSVLLGPISAISSKHEAQLMLEDRLRQINVCQAVSRAPLHFEAFFHVRYNPVRNVRLPNARLAPPQPYLTPEQVQQLVFALREPYRTIVLTAVLTGLRPSELFGLYRTDLDFQNQTMQISRSYYMGEFGLPKTNKSRRTLLMPTILCEALENHREFSKRKTSELVFSTRQGKPIDPSRVLKKAVYPVLEELKLPRGGWRAFRHTVATLLQHMGVSVKVAQDQWGHSNPTTTLGIYTHALPEARKTAVSQLAAQLFPDVPKFGPKTKKSGKQLL